MTQEGFKRKLTAILSADVEGYSRLMGVDEDATIHTLTAHRELMSAIIQKHRGRVVDSPGDNLLAEFGSVVDAVRCAVEVQEELRVRNAELPDDRRMQFRIGINLGDVVEEGDRIYGDGVNITARVEGLAEGGGICISGTVYDSIKNKLSLAYESLGEHTVKNIKDPVRVYRMRVGPDALHLEESKEKKPAVKRWQWAALAILVVLIVGAAAVWHFYFRFPQVEPASVEKMAFALPEKPSIAVLPFVNMSDDPGKEFLSDSITEQIITTLSKAPNIFVISRTSTFAYKGKSVKVQQVAEELGVRYVIEGSFQKSGDKIRITVQLIDALKGRHIWAERYERDYKNLFAVQDEITLKILNGIGWKLTEGGHLRSLINKDTSLDAWEKCIEGTTYVRAFNLESNATARRLAEETIALDPEFPMGYELLATVNIMDVWLGSDKSPQKLISQATELLNKAIGLDENYAAPYATLGHVYALQRRFDEAVEAGQKAIEINPNFDAGYVWLAMTLEFMGRPEEAIELYKKAMRLCPFPPSWYYSNLASAYRDSGRLEEAIAEYKKALHLTPQNIFVFEGLAVCYGLLGLEEESRKAADEIMKLNPNYNIKSFIKRRYLYKNQELVKRRADALRKAGIPEG